MNRIESLTIKNYRSCVNTTMKLYEPLSVLIGLNGAGKTNILNAIASLKNVESQDSDFPRLRQAFGRDQSSIVANVIIDSMQVNVKAEFFLEFDEYHENIKFAQLSYKRASDKKWLKIEKEYFDNSHIFLGRDADRISSSYKAAIFRNVSKDFDLKYSIIKLLDDITYFSATKFSDPTKCPASLEIKGNGIRTTYSRYSVHESLLKDFYRAYQEEKPFKRFLNVVGPNGLGLVDDIKFETANLSSTTSKVTIGGQLQNQESIRRIAVPTVVVDGLNLSFSQLSEGTFKSLALIFYILTSKKQILLIEEPEVSVHYGLLSSILELIIAESKYKQIIVSTHSDFVLDKIKPQNLIVVTKQRDAGTIAQPLDKAMDGGDFKYLKQYLRQTGNLGEYWRVTGFLDE